MNRRSGWARPRPSLWWVALVSVVLGACMQRSVAPGPLASVGPQLSVERFLQAANDRDFDGMARIFGSAAGPVGDTGSSFGCFFKKIGSWFGGMACERRQEVELRMAAISNILSHEDYQIVNDEQVAGRDHPTRRVLVDLVTQGRTVRGVPFEVVRGGGDQWLVERVDLEMVMAAR